MKKIDSLIIKEIFGPWFFGVAIFTVLIMAGSFLFTFTDYVAKGVGVGTVMWLILLLLPNMLVTTFPMAMLLGTLLSFGRLSGESEITAMRAAGTSLLRIMVPVASFGMAVAGVAFLFGQFVVPPASLQAAELRVRLGKQLEGSASKPTSYAVTEKVTEQGKTRIKLTSMVNAVDFDFGAQVLRKVTVLAYDKDQNRTFTLDADELEYRSANEWRIRGNASITSRDGMYYAEITDGAWPEQIARPNFSPQDIFNQNLRDPSALSLQQIAKTVQDARLNPNIIPKQIYNLEKGYWDKFAMPISALVYALLGAPLGIRNHRTGGASGFTFAVVIIFVYYLLSNVLFIAGQSGAYPAWAASFVPITLGLAAAGVTIHLKNR